MSPLDMSLQLLVSLEARHRILALGTRALEVALVGVHVTDVAFHVLWVSKPSFAVRRRTWVWARTVDVTLVVPGLTVS